MREVWTTQNDATSLAGAKLAPRIARRAGIVKALFISVRQNKSRQR